MHELGMMTSVMDAVGDAARKAGATKVLKVKLSVGEMTEAIEDCLTFAYEALSDQDPFFKGSELEVHMVKPRSRCLECGAEYEHDRFHMCCPECGSALTELIAGRDLTIDSVEVDLPDDDDAEAAAGKGPDADERADGSSEGAGAPADATRETVGSGA